MKLQISALEQDGSVYLEREIEVSKGDRLLLQAMNEDITLADIDFTFNTLANVMKDGGCAFALPYGFELKVVSVK